MARAHAFVRVGWSRGEAALNLRGKGTVAELALRRGERERERENTKIASRRRGNAPPLRTLVFLQKRLWYFQCDCWQPRPQYTTTPQFRQSAWAGR